MMDGKVAYPAGCRSGLPIQYRADGTYAMWGEAGTWRLERDQLTETVRSANPLLSDSSVPLGTSYRSTLRWNGADRFWKRYSDGKLVQFRRCPPTQGRSPYTR
jgi:hypothetical protein